MMKTFVYVITLASFAFSCNETAINSSIAKGKALPSQSDRDASGSPYGSGDDKDSQVPPGAQPETIQQPSPQPDPAAQTVDIPTPVATQPAVIGGMYLVCNPVDSGAQCDVLDKFSDKPVEPEGAEFYVIATDLVWKKAETEKIEFGKYLIKTKLSAYAVGIRDSARAVYATWVLRPQANNLVKNGSFENYSNPLDALFETSATSDWSATPTQNTTCPKYYIDIRLANAEMPAADGKRFMDLNAACDTEAGILYSNHMISQSLATIKGNLYQTFFSISGNPKATREHSFSMYWNDEKRFNSTFVPNSVLHWMELNFVRTAVSNNDKISFNDYVVNTEGAGGLIDNVQVYSLGSGPSE